MPSATLARSRRGLAHLLYCITRASVKQGLRYRAAQFSALVVNTLFGLVRASLLVTAITAAGGELHSYTAAEAITYAWLTQAMIGPLHAFSWTTLSQRIYDGSIATDLARPLSPLAWYACEFAGQSFVGLLTRSLPILVVGAITTGISLASDPLMLLSGLLVLSLAVLLQYLLYFMVNCLAFFVTQIRGIMMTYMLISQVLSGFMVPLTWFPAWYQSAAAYLPYPYIHQFSIDTFSGRLDGAALADGLARQGFWLAVCTLLAWRCVEFARRRVEVQGG
ncbi:ABC-2 family transporter protein [Micrococcales bacterium 31B]|nr:ABC-2 family transporter protein [Micrococcales bacterium 31B]